MRDPTPQPVRLEDYTPPPFLVREVALDFAIGDEHTTVRARLAIERNPAARDAAAHSVMAGIAVAVVLSLIDQVRHTYRPRTRILVPGRAGAWTSLPAVPGCLAAPGILAYRFEADLFYANASRFSDEVLYLVANAGQPVRTVILDASGIDNVDYSAAKTLLQTRAELRRRGVEVAPVATSDGVLDDPRRYGLGGAGAEVFPTLDAALAAVVERSPRRLRRPMRRRYRGRDRGELAHAGGARSGRGFVGDRADRGLHADPCRGPRKQIPWQAVFQMCMSDTRG